MKYFLVLGYWRLRLRSRAVMHSSQQPISSISKEHAKITFRQLWSSHSNVFPRNVSSSSASSLVQDNCNVHENFALEDPFYSLHLM